MTSEKLTAKLSDGTEWEVVEKWTADGPGCVRCSLKPLNPSPPKEVYVDVYASNKVSAAYVADELPSVDSDIRTRLVRYTLAPEPEEKTEKQMCLFCNQPMELVSRGKTQVNKLQDKKPAREWWDVRYLDDNRPYCSYDNEAQAKMLCEQENGYLERQGMSIRYQVVHVREVVSDEK